ncbi:MAG: hypothetical protein PF637_09515 [Spirochaetes bacterium]|jgi:uridine kinase|nr:hypothetical protein [Spirochaetota bacterium]
MLILISGGSRAGKSLFASQLVEELQKTGLNSALLSTDMFYSEIPKGTDLYDHNFDCLQSVNSEYLINCCTEIIKKKPVTIKTFEFKTHSQSGSLNLNECDILILEGIFAFCFAEINKQASLKIFIDTQESLRDERRYDHYSKKLKQSDSFIKHKMFSQAKPFFDSVIYPSRTSADIIIDGGQPFDELVQTTVNQITEIHLKQK